MLWEVKGGLRKGVFLLGRRVGSRLIIACRQKKRAVWKEHIVVLGGTRFQCCFGVVGGRQGGGVSLLMCRIESKSLRLVVLFDYPSG